VHKGVGIGCGQGCGQGCDMGSGSGDYKVCDQEGGDRVVFFKDVVIGVFWSGQERSDGCAQGRE
jgi:hypothetical protein